MATEKLRKDDLDSLPIGNEMTSEEIRRIIEGYEKQFGMTSEEFLKKWAEDTVPDTYETMDWMMLLKYRK